jgi:hypothetical protein
MFEPWQHCIPFVATDLLQERWQRFNLVNTAPENWQRRLDVGTAAEPWQRLYGVPVGDAEPWQRYDVEP